MTFFDRVRTAWAAFVAETTSGPDLQRALPFMFPAWRTAAPVPSMTSYQSYANEGYGKNAVIYSCITTIATAAPSAQLEVQVRKGARMTPRRDNKLQELLDQPNEHMSQFAMVELLHTHLNIAGNAFLLRSPDGGPNGSLFCARPDRMHIVPGRRELLGYVYIAEDGEKIPFLPQDVVHVKLPNPLDPFEGLGAGMAPLAAAATEGDVDNQATASLKAFFENAMVPFGVFTSKNILEDGEVKRIRARLREQLGGGAGKMWESLILDADATYQQMGMSMQQMEFPDLRTITETRLCAVFKVPPILVGLKSGLEHSTYSNYKEARADLWEDKIVPDNMRVADAMTAAFRSLLPRGGRIGHDYSSVGALQEDRGEKFARATSGWTSDLMTLNEARAEMGLEGRSNGDLRRSEMRAPAQLAPLNDETTPAEEVNRRGVERLRMLTHAQRKQVGVEWHRTFDRTARSHELKFMKAAQERLAEEVGKLVARARENRGMQRRDLAWTDIERAMFRFLEEDGQEAWVATFGPLMTDLLLEQGENIADKWGLIWDVTSADARNFLASYTLKFADALQSTTKEGLRKLLSQGQADGWSITKLTDEIKALYDGWDKTRAEAIARTETIRSSNAGAEVAFAGAGIAQKEWFTAEDEMVCPFCGEMHEQRQATAGTYYQVGDSMTVDVDGTQQTLRFDYEDVRYPPLHPNCRCTLLPVVED
ncbi:MAG TPA: phage portal protein [Accumulibacter sp.]|uniref:phage portal protein n=1 Tax=Accumulibacter sp. TaxID=2053492 RepID=UPI002B75882F|nr:phage portal protein [Accumulibacter sp.]HRF71749.1 phage portal protein [Accumulibacter sp.]